MDTFMDEIKNIKMLTRVVAVGVLINFAIIALLQGPDVVGFDPTIMLPDEDVYKPKKKPVNKTKGLETFMEKKD